MSIRPIFLIIILLSISCQNNTTEIMYPTTEKIPVVEEVEKLKEHIEKLQLNVVDCIVNNAATQICKSIWEYEIKEWDYTMNSNVRPIFLLTKFSLAINSMCDSCLPFSSIIASYNSVSNFLMFSMSFLLFISYKNSTVIFKLNNYFFC